MIHVSAICHASEDPIKVEKAMRTIIKELPIQIEILKSHYRNSIKILRSTAEKKDVQKLLKIIKEFVTSYDLKSDDKKIYLRFDKQEAFLGNLIRSEGNNTIKVVVPKVEYEKIGK